jgi:hypothetical protein
MYSTCLFCKNSLGSNEAIENFPIGRRLAFDGAKGRLWVVCRKCERWNLTPLEERWEAIEECERSYRATRLRTSTDQIGLARLSEGIELVRIGKPLRPEFAAWRYGDQFGRRRRQNILRAGAVGAAAFASVFVGPAIGLSAGFAGFQLFQIGQFGTDLFRRVKVAERIRVSSGNPLLVRYSEIDEAVVLRPERDLAWGLRIKHRNEGARTRPWWRYESDAWQTDVRGDDAMRAAMQLLPRLNNAGAAQKIVQDAVALATEDEDPRAAFDKAARLASRVRSWIEYDKGPMLKLLPPERRLALEMISHEDSERRALEGELHLLEDAWREAEEIAAISDDLFVSADVTAGLDELKRRSPSPD